MSAQIMPFRQTIQIVPIEFSAATQGATVGWLDAMVIFSVFAWTPPAPHPYRPLPSRNLYNRAKTAPSVGIQEESAMQIVDAQIHLWGTGLPSNLAHRQVTSFTPEEAIGLMDGGGVDAALIHPPGWDPGADEMATAAVRDYPGRFAILSSLPLDQPDSRARIATWKDQPGMLGLRYTFLSDPARQWLADGTLDWLWAAAEDAGVPVAALATDSLTVLGRIAERHPGLRLTIDHLGGRGGNTTLKDAASMTHMPELLALAKFPNVAVKATGAPGYSSEAYPFPAMHTYLEQIFDAFGPARMFWGTDITKMPCSWRQCVTMFTEELPWLDARDKSLVMGEALRAWWGWEAESSA